MEKWKQAKFKFSRSKEIIKIETEINEAQIQFACVVESHEMSYFGRLKKRVCLYCQLPLQANRYCRLTQHVCSHCRLTLQSCFDFRVMHQVFVKWRPIHVYPCCRLLPHILFWRLTQWIYLYCRHTQHACIQIHTIGYLCDEHMYHICLYCALMKLSGVSNSYKSICIMNS